MALQYRDRFVIKLSKHYYPHYRSLITNVRISKIYNCDVSWTPKTLGEVHRLKLNELINIIPINVQTTLELFYIYIPKATNEYTNCCKQLILTASIITAALVKITK